MIKKVNIIGSGNVATHLAKHLSVHVDIKNVYSRRFMNARSLADEINSFPVDDPADLSKDVDLNIVCLKDDAVEMIAEKADKHTPIVHTSGAVDISVFSEFENYGILYPLQTFSKTRAVDVNKIPFFLETSSPEFYSILEGFCHQYLSMRTMEAGSEKRAGLHLAAVISNNFSNFLLSISSDILKDFDMKLDTIEPLMNETLAKAFLNGPENSQTGPAKRGDDNTIQKHLQMLKNPKHQELYRLMTDLIREKYKIPH